MTKDNNTMGTIYTSKSHTTKEEWLMSREQHIGVSDIWATIQSFPYASGALIDNNAKALIYSNYKTFIDAVSRDGEVSQISEVEKFEGFRGPDKKLGSMQKYEFLKDTGFMPTYLNKEKLRQDIITGRKLNRRKKTVGFQSTKDKVFNTICQRETELTPASKKMVAQGIKAEPLIAEFYKEHIDPEIQGLKANGHTVFRAGGRGRYNIVGCTPDYFFTTKDGMSSVLEVKLRVKDTKYSVGQVARYLLQTILQIYTSNSDEGVLFMVRKDDKSFSPIKKYHITRDSELYSMGIELILQTADEIEAIFTRIVEKKITNANIASKYYHDFKNCPSVDKNIGTVMYYTESDYLLNIKRIEDNMLNLKAERDRLMKIHEEYIKINGVDEKVFPSIKLKYMKVTNPDTYYTKITYDSLQTKADEAEIGGVKTKGTTKYVYKSCGDEVYEEMVSSNIDAKDKIIIK